MFLAMEDDAFRWEHQLSIPVLSLSASLRQFIVDVHVPIPVDLSVLSQVSRVHALFPSLALTPFLLHSEFLF